MCRRNDFKSASCRLLALIMVLCMCIAMFAGCKKDEPAPESPTDAVSEADVEIPVGVQWGEDNVPFLDEGFEAATHSGLERGEVALEVITEEDGNHALKVTNRAENWNGVNFAVDEFRGNSISAWAKVKCNCSGIHLTLQYDLAGTQNYNWIASIGGNDTSYASVGGKIAIPAEATNVFVYVEADNLADIVVDDISVKVAGEYTPHLEETTAGFADFSGYESLKELYADQFTIGCAIPVSYVSNEHQEFIQLVTQQFNTVTLENEFKPDGILDAAASKADPAKYNESPAVHFDNVTATLDYCRDNDIKVRGHVLTWHSQTPEWLFHEDYDTTKGFASRELMLKRMENYIKSVLTWCEETYPGLFYAWDVVNEAIDDGTNKLRDNVPWTQTVGDDWVQYAFEYARKYAGEGVKLFYNDYNASVLNKCDGIIELLRPIAAAGNIDGVGMQGHINTTTSIKQFIDCAKKYADTLGVVLNVTELDIEMPDSENPEFDQGVYFQDYFKALIDAKKDGLPLEAVTVWGICDSLSWKPDKLPLLFKGDLSKKYAFDGMVCAVKGTELPIPADYVYVDKEAHPIKENYESAKFAGRPRIASNVELVTDDPYEGKQCLHCFGGESYDGYSVDLKYYAGKTINFSFAVKTTCKEMHLSGEIDGVWPTIKTINTASGEWVLVEGTYTVPTEMDNFSVYLETTTTEDFFVDALSIEPVE